MSAARVVTVEPNKLGVWRRAALYGLVAVALLALASFGAFASGSGNGPAGDGTSRAAEHQG